MLEKRCFVEGEKRRDIRDNPVISGGQTAVCRMTPALIAFLLSALLFMCTILAYAIRCKGDIKATWKMPFLGEFSLQARERSRRKAIPRPGSREKI